MRTIEEIKEAYRERATSEYAKVRTSMTGEDLATVFDYIAELEAQNAALQARAEALGEWQVLEEWFLEDGLEAIADLVDGVESTRDFVERMKGLTSSEDNDKNQRNAGRALGGIFALSQLQSWKYEG